MKSLVLFCLVLCLILVISRTGMAQSCLTKEEINKLLSQADVPHPAKTNQKLKNDLIKLAADTQQMMAQYVHEEQKKDSLTKRITEQNGKNTAKLCETIKDVGWPTSPLIEEVGVEAAFYLLKTSAPFEMQKDLVPVIIAATKKDEVQKAEFAGLLDRLRVRAGMKQLFGTQAATVNGFLVVYPIEDEQHVEQRRKQFDLAPMSEQLKNLEREYQTPIVRSHYFPPPVQPDVPQQPSVAVGLSSNLLDTPTISPEDVIRTNTNLVNLNVSVFNEQSRTLVSSLNKEEFQVLEDGSEQTITYFASTDVPFDLLLLIDLSGSTEHKRDLIRQSTRRFIEAARPGDRIAIQTFSDNVTEVSPLTSDRTQLLDNVSKIKGGGGTRVWDSLKFALDSIDAQKTADRRRAVVIMTDGVDNALSYWGDIGSKMSFSDLVEAVRHTDTLVVPIYLDTESDDSPTSWTRRIYQNARNTLSLLAQESGGSFYKAKKIADLNGVYEQVINDLGKIYSIGYKPSNEKRDSTWRRVEVKIVDKPDLVTHARPGYYAR